MPSSVRAGRIGPAEKRAEGGRAAYRPRNRFEAYAVERILADHRDAVIDLGGGHSVQEDPALFARVRAALAPVGNVVLLYRRLFRHRPERSYRRRRP